MIEITPELVLKAYAAGYFPMAESRSDPDVMWVEPKWRGVIPLDGFHVPRRLQRTIRQNRFRVTADRAFAAVLGHCGSPEAGRSETWINARITELYVRLFEQGHAHSVECWDRTRLVGGLYGVAMGRAFFGESMFSLATDASKVALVHLVARLIAGGFVLLDTQFITDHLRQFGAVEISRADYRARLETALKGQGLYHRLPAETDGQIALQLITHTS